jgi:hypothetical protein
MGPQTTCTVREHYWQLQFYNAFIRRSIPDRVRQPTALCETLCNSEGRPSPSTFPPGSLRVLLLLCLVSTAQMTEDHKSLRMSGSARCSGTKSCVQQPQAGDLITSAGLGIHKVEELELTPQTPYDCAYDGPCPTAVTLKSDTELHQFVSHVASCPFTNNDLLVPLKTFHAMTTQN